MNLRIEFVQCKRVAAVYFKKTKTSKKKPCVLDSQKGELLLVESTNDPLKVRVLFKALKRKLFAIFYINPFTGVLKDT